MDHFEPVFDSSNVDIYLNAEIGNSPKIYELSRHYDAIVMCTGMSDSRRNWTEAQNSFGADEIFGWYNRNPKFLTLGCDLSKVKHLVIIGNGNVALDMARIFSKNPSQLSTDSLDPDVFKVLEKSDITDITILGRRDITKVTCYLKLNIFILIGFLYSSRIKRVQNIKLLLQNQRVSRIK